jgi:hypothetical protein
MHNPDPKINPECDDPILSNPNFDDNQNINSELMCQGLLQVGFAPIIAQELIKNGITSPEERVMSSEHIFHLNK